MGTGMLSAAGVRNMRSRVRSDASKKSVGDGAEESSKENRSNGLRGRSTANYADADADYVHPRRSRSLDVRRMSRNGVDRVRQTGRNGVKRVRHTGRSGVERVRQTGRSGVDRVKQTTSSGVDRVKRTGRNGVDRIKTGGSHVLERTQNTSARIRSKAPRPLPSRSLFQHKPRTWLGAKKDKGNKVKEDWRNVMPSGAANRGSSKKTGKGEKLKTEHVKREFDTETGNEEQRPVGRSRSAPSKVTFSGEEDWHQYVVDAEYYD